MARPFATSCGLPPITSLTVPQPDGSVATLSGAAAADRAESPAAAVPPALARRMTPPVGAVSAVPALQVPVGHSAGWLVGTEAVPCMTPGTANLKPATVSLTFAPVEKRYPLRA